MEQKELLLNTAEYLNAGCGLVRYDNCVNMDIADNPLVNIDIVGTVLDIPFRGERFKGVILSHVLEHLNKKDHVKCLSEIHRVLKPEGTVYIEVPDFIKALQFYLDNFQGRQDYWYMCIYGRDAYSSDVHRSGISEQYLTDLLFDCGFRHLKWVEINKDSALLAVTATKTDELLGNKI
jgi:SAM-dependent methyltransferase